MSLALRDVERVIPNGEPSTTSETCFAQYVHSPLQDVDEIRLLCIEPGSWESDPQCTLSHHRLPQCPPFEALSYVWGSEEKPCKIGCGENGTLAVTRNCFAAIKRLRKLGSLVVWIDAVCIDQNNDLERGHQVKNMPRIYETATKVLVYLGEAEDHGDEAMEILRFYKWNLLQHLDVQAPLRKLMQRSWFERIWVLQEVNKAQTVAVICGDNVIPWDPCFRLLVQWGPENFVRNGLPFVLQVRGRDRNKSQSWDLFDLMVNTRSYKCTDPRDRAFALLSMSSEDSRHGIEPDYTATVEDVYTRAATHFLNRMGLNFLAMVDHGHRKMSKLPSWVPDWSRRPTCTPITHLIDQSPSFALRKYSLVRRSTLRICGKFIGTVDDLGQVFGPDNSGWDKACIEDWDRLFVKWHPDADIASLDPVLHMSELYQYDPWNSFKTGFRCLIQSAAHTLLGIVETERKYQPARNVVFQSHGSELLCSDEFLSRLRDPQFERQAALELLAGCSSELSQVCMELHAMRSQSVSYPEIITGLKKALIDEIRGWNLNEAQFSRYRTISAVVHGLREPSALNPDFRNSLSLLPPLRRSRVTRSPMQQTSQVIISLLQMRFTLELRHMFPRVKRLTRPILYGGLYTLFESITDQNLSVSEEKKHPAEPTLHKHIEQLNSRSVKRIKQCCEGRRLFVNDRIAGLVPASAQKGDVLCILNGCAFPVLLRNCHDHEVLVGACYVIGDIESRAQGQRDFRIK